MPLARDDTPAVFGLPSEGGRGAVLWEGSGPRTLVVK
ncbi:hypothetical protein LCGC14_1447180, partial [marine sediment metagenome]